MKRVDYKQVAPQALTQIDIGAFLTVKAGEEKNVMTIGWATIGPVWHKPIMMVAVRLSRHTFGLIEKAADFTVSVPLAGTMKKELAFCGNKSGRDYDKFKECNLQVQAGQRVDSPIIKLPGIHYECKIIYKSALAPNHFNPTLDQEVYPQKDYHTLYFGEIVDCYELE